MNLYNKVCLSCSKEVTNSYSTSFSLAVMLLEKRFRDPIYSIYGFVRLADEIVDTFYGYNQRDLLHRFREETYQAIDAGISTNPILQSFQLIANEFAIERQTIDAFLYSMEMDLDISSYDSNKFDQYVYGSAEAVGLMCLKVFCEGNSSEYNRLKPYAQKLGRAFQKVNFLRDMKDDYVNRGRNYFPNATFDEFTNPVKQQIEQGIEEDFTEAFIGIKELPAGARLGVYLAYRYYLVLHNKIKKADAADIVGKRYSVSNITKVAILSSGYVRNKLGIIE